MARKDKSGISLNTTSSLAGYEDFLSELKTKISSAQVRAAVAVNKELVLLVSANWSRYSQSSTVTGLGSESHQSSSC